MAGHPVGVTVVHPGGIRTAVARSARAAGGIDQAASAAYFDAKMARTTPERAAEVIVRGILRNQARVLVGVDAHVVHQVGKLLGSRYQDLFAARFREIGLREIG